MSIWKQLSKHFEKWYNNNLSKCFTSVSEIMLSRYITKTVLQLHVFYKKFLIQSIITKMAQLLYTCTSFCLTWCLCSPFSVVVVVFFLSVMVSYQKCETCTCMNTITSNDKETIKCSEIQCTQMYIVYTKHLNQIGGVGVGCDIVLSNRYIKQ